MLEIAWRGPSFRHIRQIHHSRAVGLAEVRAAVAVERAEVLELRQAAECTYQNQTGRYLPSIMGHFTHA
jgi:hypothetical protein